MDISEISSAKGLKFNLQCVDSNAEFKAGDLIRLEHTREERAFLVSQFGAGSTEAPPTSCIAGRTTAEYLHELLQNEEYRAFRCLFEIDCRDADTLEVQAYTFQSITEYKTPIVIAVAGELEGSVSIDRLNGQYIWHKLGKPALFCMNYKNEKKRSEGLRLVGGRRYLIADRTEQGILARRAAYLKYKYDVPIDVFVAPQIRFVPESEVNGTSSPFLDDIEAISNPSSYFARWEAYNVLSRKLSEQEAGDFGRQRYELIRTSKKANGTQYIFETEEEIDGSYLGRELGVPLSNGDQAMRKAERLVAVGRVVKISGREVTTLLEYDDDIDVIPTTGVLKLNMTGDRAIMKRRESARDRIINNRAPIPGLVSLIEAGTPAYELPGAWGVDEAVTTKFKRNFPRASTLNSEQLAALELALNTPDVALIQGPPGTGKTTVIKGICERFREVFEERERQNQRIDPDHLIRSPKILISSFQNEAVDNAISDPLPRDVPAFRKTSKRMSDGTGAQYSRSLEQWYNQLRASILSSMGNSTVSEFIELRDSLDDEYLSYKNAGEPIERAASLINRYLGFVDIAYPDDLVATATAIVKASRVGESEDLANPIVRRIESQRTSREAFEDDGPRNARRLAAYIRMNDDVTVPDNILTAIQAVCDEGFTDEDFETYVRAVDELRERFCKRAPSVSPGDKETISGCILALASYFSDHYTNTLSSLEDRKSIVLAEFLERLGQDYESVVKKYSMTTAATCQASMDLYENADKIYDLVIVDEAARANPLDLFIPMSMGRKVILVGDQKQLPHMLEPDIVKMLAEEADGENIDKIEQSLFERLFDMLSKGRRPRAVKLTRQYRMHPDICRFVSESFYDGLLTTAEDITPGMRSCSDAINNGRPLAFIDIPISRGPETGGSSKSRMCEVVAIGEGVRRILREDPGRRIGVITFYSAQAKLIASHLEEILNDEERDLVEAGTVDAFQGKEFDYVLLSCVRSNSPRDGSAPNVGFLEKPNRLCVAFSRAIRQLAVYGDARTLSQIPCFAQLHSMCREGGGYLGAC